MKKILIALLICVSVLSLAGCSNPSNTSDEPNSSSISETVKGNSSSNATVSTDEVKYANKIPDPADIFKTGNISVLDKDGGKAYIFRVENYQDGEYENYVAKCKEMGFSDVSYDSENDGGKMFGAYDTSGEYWVEVLLGNDSKNITVTCKESTKKN